MPARLRYGPGATPFSPCSSDLHLALFARPTYLEVPVDGGLSPQDLFYRTALIECFAALARQVGAQVVALGSTRQTDLASLDALGIHLLKDPPARSTS